MNMQRNIDTNTILPALQSLRPGRSIVYHRGHLAADKRNDPDLRLIAETAWDLSEARRVHLTQRRIGRPQIVETVTGPVEKSPGFEYIATGAAV